MRIVISTSPWDQLHDPPDSPRDLLITPLRGSSLHGLQRSRTLSGACVAPEPFSYVSRESAVSRTGASRRLNASVFSAERLATKPER